jgi:hypothetical protein
METKILEEHHHVLPLWLQKYKETGPLTVLHIDSHSDLSFREENEQIDIGNFIIEAFKLGILKKIIWLKPPQSIEIPECKEKFLCGYVEDTDTIGCTSSLLYFCKETYDENLLFDTFVVDIRVTENPESIDLSNEENVVIDVDLDYFYCNNPNKSWFIRKHGLSVFNELNEKFIKITSKDDLIEFEKDLMKRGDQNLIDSFMIKEIGYPAFLFPTFSSDQGDWDEAMKKILKIKFNLDSVKLCTLVKSVSSGYTPADKWRSIASVVNFYFSNVEHILARNLL